MKLVIAGRVQSSGKIPFERGLFTAYALVAGEEVAQAAVEDSGEFSIAFEAGTAIPAVEVWVAPAFAARTEAGTMALRKTIGAAKFTSDAAESTIFRAHETFFIPADILRGVLRRVVSYHVHGTAYVQHATFFERLPGARIDFYEVDSLKDAGKSSGLPFPTVRLRDQFLGTAYTAADGSYDFHFKFPAQIKKKPGTIIDFGDKLLPVDSAPDVRARISLFINGAWTKVYEVPMADFDWNIGADFHRDYLVPASAAVGTGINGVKPDEGLRYIALGLIPIDNSRFHEGYVTTEATDPLPGIRHQPLCGILNIFALFASSPAIKRYAVERVRTDAFGTPIGTETYQPITDPLINHQWDPLTRRWDPHSMNETDGKYRNIDIDPEADWLQHSLKIQWNTTNEIGGYYRLRITGYDATNTAIPSVEMPVVRVDNAKPQAYVDVSSPSATTCGDLNLGTDRLLTFQVTAYQENGHLLRYWLAASRGRYAESAGPTVTVSRPPTVLTWEGEPHGPMTFTVADRSTATQGCSTMAYSFHLYAQGSATNGYYVESEGNRTPAETNLIISE